MGQSLTGRYDEQIAGVLSCYDRVMITGTLPTVCYAAGMTRFLHANGILIFVYTSFARTLKDVVRENAAAIGAQAGIAIQHISKTWIREEDVVARVLEQRGDRPGLVHIISAMERRTSDRPWREKATGKVYVRPDTGKCRHYYFYFLDPDVGLVHLRVPT